MDGTSLHFLHPRAYVLLDDVLQLQGKPDQSVPMISFKDKKSRTLLEQQGASQLNFLALKWVLFPLGTLSIHPFCEPSVGTHGKRHGQGVSQIAIDTIGNNDVRLPQKSLPHINPLAAISQRNSGKHRHVPSE